MLSVAAPVGAEHLRVTGKVRSRPAGGTAIGAVPHGGARTVQDASGGDIQRVSRVAEYRCYHAPAAAPPIGRVVGYVRVSTGDQAAEGFGLEAQRDAIGHRYRADGYELVAIVGDDGLSGLARDLLAPCARRCSRAV